MDALLQAARPSSAVPMDCEESTEEASKSTREALKADSTGALAVESADDQTETDRSSSSKNSDGHQNSAEVSALETESELTEHTTEVSSSNEQTENTTMECSAQAARCSSAVPMDCEETTNSVEDASKSTHEALVADSTEMFAVESTDDQTDMDKSSSLNESDTHQNLAKVSALETETKLTGQTKEVSSSNEQNKKTKTAQASKSSCVVPMDCEETITSMEEALKSTHEALVTDSTEMLAVESTNDQTDIDRSSSSNESDGHKNSAEISALETESELTEHTKKVSSSNQQIENTKTECSAQAEESKAPTTESGLTMEITDESNSVTKNKSSAVELKEAPSASAEEKGVKNASQNKKLDTAAEKGDASSASVVMDLEAKELKQASSMDSGPKKPGQVKKQALAQKPKVTKIISLSKVAPNSGKAVNIQIVSKDQKTAMNVNDAPSIVKRVLAPKESTSKKLPLILPKGGLLPKTVSSAVPLTSAPSKNLQNAVVPQSFLVLKTKAGLSLMPVNQVKNGTVKTPGAESKKVPNISGPQNINICNTPSSSVGIVNTPITSKTSCPIVSLPLQLKVHPPKFSTSPVIRPVTFPSGTGLRPQLTSQTMNSPLLLSTAKALEQTKARALEFIDVCQHPTCSTYRDKVIEELKTKQKMRDRKLKSVRMGKQRAVKRAANQAQMVKNLQRQRAVLSALESFPDELCKILMKAQMKPDEGVRAKSLHEKALKEFATNLHLISPKAYDIVRGIFNKVLPESASIDNWNFARAEVPVTDSAEKAANSDEDEESDSDSDGDEEMADEEF